MDTPSTREEFERRFHLLREKIRTGTFHSPYTGGLDQVRHLPNGRLDILSINESARLQANMMSQFDTDRFQDLIKEQDIDNQSD